MTDQNAAPEAVAERIAQLMMMRPTSLGPAGNVLAPLEPDQIAQWCVESAETMGVASGTIARLQQSEDSAYSMLSLYGVSKERAKSVSNGIDVLATRYRKDKGFDQQEIAALTDRNRALTEALEKYGQHYMDCPAKWAANGVCHCGWKSIHPTQPKEPNDG